MKTMKKIVAILAVALLLCSMLPLSVMAAETTITFELGANGTATHNDGKDATSYSETVGDYTLSITGGTKMYTGAYDAKGNSCIKLGTSSVVGGFTINVPADVTSVIIYAAKYKAKASKLSVAGTTYTLSNSSDNGAYDEIIVDTTTAKTIAVTSVSGGVRAMINTIKFVIATVSADCAHDELKCGETCEACDWEKPHAFANDCATTCSKCDAANPDYNGVGHTYTSDYDATCNTCFDVRNDSLLPDESEDLTLEEAIAIGAGQDTGVYTEQKYYITGIITEVYDTTWGNMYITDGTNTFTVYGLYNNDGTVRYDAMEYKPNVSDEITVYGNVGNYNGAPQMKNAWLDDVVVNCAHAWDNDCDTDCNLNCGLTREPKHSYNETIVESTCTTAGTATYVCSVCQDSYSEELALAAHNYVDGKCSVCNAEKPAGPTKIDSVANLTAGIYKMAGYLVSYTNSGTTTDWTNNPWHVWTGAVDGDLVTTPYSYDEATGEFIVSGADLDEGADIELIAVEGKANTYYICVDGQYLYSSAAATNRKLALGETPAEWVASDNANGGITLSSNSVYLGTAGAVTKLLRSYKGESTLKYGVAFFAFDSEPSNPDCQHDKLLCGDTCGECEEYVKEHVFANNCAATCSNCDAANPNYADHVWSGDYDATCNVCDASREVSFPEADSVLTISDAIAMGQGMDHNTFSPNKYYVTGVITEVYNADYGNMYIKDDEGNTLTIYGTYSADGSARYDAMENAPVAGDTVTIYGVVGQYNGTSQVKNGWITEMTKPIFSQLLVQFIGRMPSNDSKNRLYISLSNDGETWTDAVEYGGHGMDVWGCANTVDINFMGTIDVTEIAKSLTSDKFYVKVGMGAGVLDQVVLHQVRVVGIYTGETEETEFFWDDYSLLPAFGRDGNNADEAVANLKANISNIVDANNAFLQQCNVGHTATGISPYHGGFYGEPENVNGYVVYAINQELPEEPSDKVFFEIYGRLPGDVNNHVQVLVSSDGSNWNQATLWGGPDGEHSSETYAKIDITNAVDMTANNLYVKVNLISYLAEWYSIRQIRVTHMAIDGTETTLMHVDYDAMAIGSEEYKSGMYIDSANVQLRGTYGATENDPSGLTMNEDCDGADGKVLGDNYITYKIVLKEVCEHEYDNACDVDCNLCYEGREVEHSVKHVEAKAATCAENGNIEYWYCDVCGMAWLNAECTLNTNLRAVVLPATGEHTYDDEYDADCNVCGDIRDVPEKPVTGVVYGDANGDGVVDLTDASLIQQYLAGYDVTVETSADANGDGVVDLTDASLIQQYLAGYDVQLGPDEPVEPEETRQYNDGTLTVWPQN